MTKRMLIDAAHAEETRVVVLDGTRVEEFDFESRNLKQLRGNIYLAKVIRVEPSLQAAFVEYGGNRPGFLAFNEIHPDYFQIPHEDREALIREAAEDEDDGHAPATALDENGEEIAAVEDDEDVVDAQEERRRRRLMRRYKIQEVIRRRQIMLVQVVKEERGNKGAALTTYLSLAGRYGVLMPNTDRGGGISRKITTATDRKRLKTVVQSLGVPKGMGLIVRTAGAKRTKAEIKRDYDYLVRLWESIRETTMHSIAPALIYEEEDLVKRAIRDLYDKELEGIWVEGEAGYREARDFMRMLMPSQAKKVMLYSDPTPLFVRHRIEDALAQIYSPVVPLKSGGYLVINQTEALVAIDVNSGRATRERNIEATALKTNTEAAEEAARQLRLRDLAGLVVIDFIDMDEAKNNRAVEKRLKDCLDGDRARVQMGRISSFGLMEISRQRRRTGVLEGTTMICPHCAGVGRVRTIESAALGALRAVEGEALKGGGQVIVKACPEIALYILNHKRADLARIQRVHGLFVSMAVDDSLSQADVTLERTSSIAVEASQAWEPPALITARADYVADDDADNDIKDEDDEDTEAELANDLLESPRAEGPTHTPRDDDARREEDGGRRRGRRRRGRRDEARSDASVVEGATLEARPPAALDAEDGDEAGGDAESRRRRRRGRRGGRRMREETRPLDVYAWAWPARSDDPYQWRGPAAAQLNAAAEATPVQRHPEATLVEEAGPDMATEVVEATVVSEPTSESTMDVWVELPAEDATPKRARRPRKAKAEAALDDDGVQAAVELEVSHEAADIVAETPPEPVIDVAPETTVLEVDEPDSVKHLEPTPALEVVLALAEPEAPAAPDPAEILAPPAAPKRGWWRRG